MNRVERRAIAFGRAFSPRRWMYNIPVAVGIDADLHSMWAEYCEAQPNPDNPLDYVWECLNDWYNGD